MKHAATALPALACAALVGFSAHRASLCNVRAVAEIMTEGTAAMLGSLMQAAMWMALITGGLTVAAGQTMAPVLMPTPAAWALAGGYLFGAGAAINGGCSLSTLNRLADGDLRMAVTLLGLVPGIVMGAALPPVVQTGIGASPVLTLVPVARIWNHWPLIAPWLLSALLIWAVFRLVALWRLFQSNRSISLPRRMLAPQYPLAVSAALMGLASSALYAMQGAWSYTSHMRVSVLQIWSGSPVTTTMHTALVLALGLGLVASAIQRGSFRWRRPGGPAAWLRHLTGGLLMGAGAAMVPGGNDTLLLNALPTLAAHAIGAYVCMLAGIASVLWLARVPVR